MFKANKIDTILKIDYSAGDIFMLREIFNFLYTLVNVAEILHQL